MCGWVGGGGGRVVISNSLGGNSIVKGVVQCIEM